MATDEYNRLEQQYIYIRSRFFDRKRCNLETFETSELSEHKIFLFNIFSCIDFIFRVNCHFYLGFFFFKLQKPGLKINNINHFNINHFNIITINLFE